MAVVAVCAQTREIPNPALAGSGQSYLAVSPDGRVYLSWTEPSGTGYRLQFAVWENESWQLAGRVAEGATWFVNWADYPTFLPLPGGAFAAHWLEKAGSSSYSYGIKLAQLRTASASWKIVFAPKVQKEGQYTGFVSLVALAQGMGAAYLAPGTGGGEEDKALRFVRIGSDGAVLSDEMLDPDVCTCCQTSAALTEAGPIIAYRGHAAGEIRDISVVSFRDGKWLAPRAVHRDGWRINACPVNGPALAASGKRVWAAWYTAADDTPRVQIASSKDAGLTFEAPHRLDEGSPIGRVAVVLLPDGGAIGSWIEKKPGGGAEIKVRRVASEGRLGAIHTVAAVDAARKTGFPKMVLHGNTLLLTWTADRVRTVAMTIPSI
jgi:hypothetical protein